MAYYKTINGKKYDGDLLDFADAAIAGSGDGRISLKDAQEILGKVMDAEVYTDIEKDTMAYIRDNYKWTPEADEWFRTEIRKWAATK